MACNCNSLLHVANAAVAEVPANGNVPLGTTVRQLGCACRLNGDGIVLAPGTYEVTGTVTLAPAATADATATNADSGSTLAVRLLSGGSNVLGAYAAAEATGTATLPVAATVTASRGTTLTLSNVGDAASVANVSVVVARV